MAQKVRGVIVVSPVIVVQSGDTVITYSDCAKRFKGRARYAGPVTVFWVRQRATSKKG